MTEKFYKMPLDKRLDSLDLTPELRQTLDARTLAPEILDSLTENAISEVEIPLGLCFLTLDGVDYKIPMATEEPSVIAAANHGAKLAGDFHVVKNERLMSGQIVFYEVADADSLAREIMRRSDAIFATAKATYPSIYKRGGGLTAVKCQPYTPWLSVDFTFDTKDAMGANMINTMLEAIADDFRDWFPDEKILFAILTNEICHCQTTVSCEIPLSDGLTAEMAAKIAVASDYAQLDPARAATHNKGIMNGVEAVVLATGNDTRGVNAAVYASADKKGLSSWNFDGEKLSGEITLHLPVATAGGATSVLPKAAAAHEILGQPDATTLSALTAAVGLANNLAALKALTGAGIQKGHMALQARSLALSAGAASDELEKLVKALKKAPQMNRSVADALLEAIRIEGEVN